MVTINELKQFFSESYIRFRISNDPVSVCHALRMLHIMADDEDLNDLHFEVHDGVKYLTGKAEDKLFDNDGIVYRRCCKCGNLVSSGYRNDCVRVIKDIVNPDSLTADANIEYMCRDCFTSSGLSARLQLKDNIPTEPCYCDPAGTIRSYVFFAYDDGSDKPVLAFPRIIDGRTMETGRIIRSRSASYMLMDNPSHLHGGDDPYFVKMNQLVDVYDPEQKDNPIVLMDRNAIDSDYEAVSGIEDVDHGINCCFPVYVKSSDMNQFAARFASHNTKLMPYTYMEPDEDSIADYHSWDETFTPLIMPGEDPDTTILYGLELETEGYESNAGFALPYSDICHLEYDGSLNDGGFEIIFMPMSWEYIMSIRDRLSRLFSALRVNGQVSSDSSHCGLHVHVSYLPFGMNSSMQMHVIEHIVAIANGMRKNMSIFARRDGNQYVQYNGHINANNLRMTYDAIDDEISCGDRYRAVNCCNIDDYEDSDNIYTTDNKPTIEFRMFKGSLNTLTVLASVELVKNIVDAAIKQTPVVSFDDLIDHSIYVPAYIRARQRYGACFTSETVYFEYADFERLADEFYSGVISKDVFMNHCDRYAIENRMSR